METIGGLLIIIAIVYLILKPKMANESNDDHYDQVEREVFTHPVKQKTVKVKHVHKHVVPKEKKASRFSNSLHCPKCRGFNVQVVGNTRKGFSVGKAVGGAIIQPGVGALAGFAGKKNKKPKFHCASCGNVFKYKI